MSEVERPITSAARAAPPSGSAWQQAHLGSCSTSLDVTRRLADLELPAQCAALYLHHRPALYLIPSRITTALSLPTSSLLSQLPPSRERNSAYWPPLPESAHPILPASRTSVVEAIDRARTYSASHLAGCDQSSRQHVGPSRPFVLLHRAPHPLQHCRRCQWSSRHSRECKGPQVQRDRLSHPA